MEKWEQFRADLGLFSADERAVLLSALEAGQVRPGLLVRLAQARRRTCQRADSDAVTDQARRLLVGTRLPREPAEKYRQCASSHGLSLYRFVSNALEREYWRLKDNDVGGIM